MKSPRYFLLLILLITIPVLPQKKNLTLRQATVQSYVLNPKPLSQADWIPGTNDFSYVEKNLLLKGNVNNINTETIIALSDMNKALSAINTDTLSYFPRYDWTDSHTIKFWDGNKLVSYDLNMNKATELNAIPDNTENKDEASNHYVAYTIDNNLYFAANGENTQITKDENKWIVNGQSVHRDEFGIYKGTFWSPTGNYLAFYRMDETMVTDYPVIDFTVRPAKVHEIKYPMAGMTSHQVTVGVYNTKQNDIVWLNTGEPKDHYLTGVTWSPDEKYIFIGILNRDQNYLREIKFDAASGQPVKTLFEETSDKYVHPMHGPIFVKGKNNEFIWFSERYGWDHLYLYNTDGKLLKQLTRGKWVVTSLDGFDNTGENAYFTATKVSPVDRDYYKVNLSSGEITRISNGTGVHNVNKDERGNYFLDSYSSLTVPNKTQIVNSDGKIIRNVFTTANPLEDYNIGQTKIFTLKSNDDYDLYCRMILPPEFDSTKVYPVLVYVYGGPGVQLITNRWLGGANLWLNYMAEQGYIVFTLDNRGSANRGLAFEQETFRHLGTKEIEDQKVGVNYLKSLPYVDAKNMGVFGWSYGGFMATSLMTRTPDLFKAGVAGAPVIDWKYYEVMYTERYMDTPQQNPEGYEKADLLNYVKDLKGKFLMVQGTSDITVVWQHTLMYTKKAADLGIPMDYFPYTGHVHGVRGIDVYHLYDKITTFFNNNLK
ncbi:MAG: DPP IV N-terminal domain-containing protein [Ignavibacteriaceae bacterium]